MLLGFIKTQASKLTVNDVDKFKDRMKKDRTYNFNIGFPFRTIEMIKDKNENLEISIDTLEKSNSVLQQSNNNLQQSRDQRNRPKFWSSTGRPL